MERVSLLLALTLFGACIEPDPRGDGCRVRVETESDVQALRDPDYSGCRGWITVSNTSFTDLDSFSGMQTEPVNKGWSLLSLSENGELTNIEGVMDTAMHFFSVRSSPLEGELSLPPKFTSVSVEDVPATSLVWNGPRPGDDTRSLFVSANPNLTSISAPNTEQFVDLYLQDLPLLSGVVEGFPSLTSVDGLRIERCALITTAEIDALAALLPEGKEAIHCGNADDAPCEPLSED